MKVLLVANYLPDRQESMQRFAEVLARELPQRGVSAEVIRPEPRLNFQKRADGLGKYPGYIDKLLLFPPKLKRRARALDECVVHICDHSNAFYTRYLKCQPHVVTCHDMLAVRSARGEFPQNLTRWSGRKLQNLIAAGLDRAQRIVCVSEATRADVLRLTNVAPEHVEMIPNGLNYPYTPMSREAAAAELRKFRLPERFILHVGSDHWYKNRRGLLKIYADVRKLDAAAPPLVLAGAGLAEAQRELVRALGVESYVTVVPRPTSEELRALYSTAELLLFPSLVEGFGWPIIEAQACGCPVVMSNRAPMNEIGGPAAFYIDPEDAMGAARRVVALLQEGQSGRARRGEQSIANAARFSTGQMIEGYLRVYRALAPRPVVSDARAGLFPATQAGNAPLQARAAVR